MNRLFLIGSGILFGLLLIAQVKSGVLPAWSDSLSEMNDHQAIVETLARQQQTLQERLKNLAAEEKTYQQSAPDELKAEISRLDTLLGKTEVSGSGISILLNTMESSTTTAADLRDILNVLRISRAAAIAINNERILVSTPIIPLEKGVLIGGKSMQSPFRIDAVGDIDILLSSLARRDELESIRKRTKTGEIALTAESKLLIEIPPFTGVFPKLSAE